MERGRVRKNERPLPSIDIDEKAFRKGQNYIALLYGLDRGTVEGIAMDMSAAFVKIAKQNLAMAETEIVHDRFPAVKLAAEAMGKVRRREHRGFSGSGNFRLNRLRYLWLSSQKNPIDTQRA